MFDFKIDRSSNKREYTYSGGKITVERKDPYGLWEVADKSSVPPHLQGQYTSQDMLEKDLFPWMKEMEVLLPLVEEVAKSKKAS